MSRRRPVPALPARWHLIPGRHREHVLAWWRALDDGTRAELRGSQRGRSGTTGAAAALGVDGDEPRRLPIALCGSFEPSAATHNPAWHQDLFDYVAAHEDASFFLEDRTFQICRAHPAARRVAETGVIPAGFVCPAARLSAACPLARAASLRPACAVHLRRASDGTKRGME